MKKTFKKYVAGAFMVALFGIYAGYQSVSPAETELSNSSAVSTVAITTDSTGALSSATADAESAATPPTNAAVQTVATASAPAAQSGYTDGVYTGSSVNAFYGNVQVKVTVSGGKVTDVTALTVPSDQHESQQINNRAVPKLRSEVIAAQSSSVNAVSGATYTSVAYKQSVASALAQA